MAYRRLLIHRDHRFPPSSDVADLTVRAFWQWITFRRSRLPPTGSLSDYQTQFQKSLVLIVVVTLALLAATASGAAYAQLVPGSIRSFVLDITQAVPVEITAPVTLDNGDVITVTAPLTLTVEMRVHVAGQGTAKVVEETAPVVNIIDRVASVFKPVPMGANDDEVLAQLTAYKSEVCDSNLTSLQANRVVEKYSAFFANREVQLTGTIDDVRESMGEYNIIVSLDKIDVDIMVDKISIEQAETFAKGDKVLLTGTLAVSGCYIYVQLTGTAELAE